MKFYINFIDCAIDADFHLVTALKGLQPGYGLARNNCPNSTVAVAGILAKPPFQLQQIAQETTTVE